MTGPGSGDPASPTGLPPLAVQLDAQLSRLAPGYPRTALCVALSGGVDSVVLLQATALLAAARPGLRLRALHVDHGLQASAGDWARGCSTLCTSLGVPLGVLPLQLAPRPGESVEALAREARYAALAAALQPGECLLTAHHQDDQLETLLLQLLRGAGLAGLAAMPPAAALGHGWHLRPLLDRPRAELLAHARSHGLAWVDDPMNADERYDRAYLRARVLPALRARWPAAGATVGRAARHLAGAQQLLAALAARDAAPLLAAGRLAVGGLLALPRERQSNVLRWWLGSHGLGAPSTTRLAAILDDVAAARADAMPVVRWPAGEVRRYRGHLYAMRPLGPPPGGDWPLHEAGTTSIPGAGDVWLEPAIGQGLAVARLQYPLTIRFRQGGEVLQLPGNPLAKPLKQHFQEAGVEPWLRDRIPFIYAGDDLIAVGEHWLAGTAAAGPTEPGLRLRWSERQR